MTTSYDIRGINIGTAAAGIRYKDRDDLVLFELMDNSTTAATFTLNRFAAAPVIIAKKHLAQAATRFLLINAGNANAGTGQRGMEDALSSCQHLAKTEGIDAENVLPFSTGVIGEYLPMDKLLAGIDAARQKSSPENWQAAATAIMTTDTKPKLVCEEFSINGKTCRITGICKGSGMIHPNMATMLAFIGTDAGVPQSLLQTALNIAVEDSFNCITVDGDTSTNDACVASATAQGDLRITDEDLIFEAFTAKLTYVCQQLAELIVRDGEGATKLARIKVVGGKNRQECKAIAYTVALSPLVKTALFGNDPNWGRILAAVGRAPVEAFELCDVDIYLDDVCIVRQGEKDKWYTEEDGQRVMQRAEITIQVDMNQGDEDAEILTSDLSHDYVSINADYRS